MSYLDVPRLHFGGLFYTGPSTINNITQNYMTSTVLVSPPGSTQYDTSPEVAGWNPLGVAQWYLQECTVLSGVGTDDTLVTSSTNDPVIGAKVESPSPTVQMSDGNGGFYDIAKMVDLDPDQQGRSALYGVRIRVTLPNGAGFQGLLTVPEIRQLNGRVPGIQSSYGAVCNWMGTLQNVVWSGDVSGSTLLSALQTAGAEELAVNLVVDLHQNNPANIFTSGDIFCYGRVLGTIGPVLAGELPTVVPGRCIQTYSASSSPTPLAATRDTPAPAAKGRVLQGRDRVVAMTAAMQPTPATASAAAARPPSPWNPAFCVIRPAASGGGGVLSIDIGACTHLTQSNGVSDGTFVVNDGISVGVFDASAQAVTAFQNGSLTVGYAQLTSTSKNCVLPTTSGAFTFAISETEMQSVTSAPIGIAVNGTVVAAEYASGYWIDAASMSQRLQCVFPVGTTPVTPVTGTTQIMVRQFGQPVSGVAAPITPTVYLFEWVEQQGNWNPNPTVDQTDLTVTFGNTDTNGIADVTITVNTNGNTLPAIRQPLDSYIYYIFLAGPDGKLIGDGALDLNQGILTPNITVLLWNPYNPPPTPTWDDAGPVLSSYARLYPGMTARLDIGDEATVKGFAPVILGRMSLPPLDPGFMPVTRDLSPTMTTMVLDYLASLTPSNGPTA